MPAPGLRFPRVGDHWHPRGYGLAEQTQRWDGDAHAGGAVASRGAGRQTVPGCVCSGFELLKGRKPCCFRDGTRFSVRSGAQHRAWQPAMARSCRWGRCGTTQQWRWKERNGSSAGLPSTLGGLRAPPPCVLDAATYPLSLLLGALGGCASPPGRPRNSRDLPHPAWQCPGLRGLRATG